MSEQQINIFDSVISMPGTIAVCYRTYKTYMHGAWPTNRKITVCWSSIWRFKCHNSNVHTCHQAHNGYCLTLNQQTAEGILASILKGLKKPACIESFVSVRWLTLDRLDAPLRHRILCECTMAYIGQTGCSVKTGTNGSSILNKSAVVEHGINILLKDKDVLARKYGHINCIMWDMIVIELCCDWMVTT